MAVREIILMALMISVWVVPLSVVFGLVYAITRRTFRLECNVEPITAFVQRGSHR